MSVQLAPPPPEVKPKKPIFGWVLFIFVCVLLGILAVLSIKEQSELADLEANLSELDVMDSVKYCQLKAQVEGQAPVFCAEVIKKYRNHTFECLPQLSQQIFQQNMQKEILIGKKKYKHITFGKNMKALDFQNIQKNTELIRLSGVWEELSQLIENARWIESLPDKKGNPAIQFHVLENEMSCQQTTYTVRIILKESAMGLYLYDVSLN